MKRLSEDIEKTDLYTRGKREYKVEKKIPKVRDKRKDLMPRHRINKQDFHPSVRIKTDFKCRKCEREIEGSVVFVPLSDVEVTTIIRVEKNIYHELCIDYSESYPNIGILPLRKERINFDKSKQTQIAKNIKQEKQKKQKMREKWFNPDKEDSDEK